MGSVVNIDTDAHANGRLLLSRPLLAEDSTSNADLKSDQVTAAPPPLGDCTALHSIANCVALLIGLGVLSSPYAIARGGLASLSLNFLFAGAYYYTSTLLVHCLEAHPELCDYQGVGSKAFGKRGRLIATSLLFGDLLSTLVSYGISLTDNLVIVFPSTTIGFMGLRGRYFLTFLATLVLLPTVWVRSYKSLSVVSASSITSSALVLLALLWLAYEDNIGIHKSIPLVRWDGLPIASGIYLFTYGTNIILPSIRTSMIERRKFRQVLGLSFAIAATFYGGIGLLGASMFGGETQSQVTLNMPYADMASKIAIWANIITPLTKFTLLLRPVASELETLLPWPLGSKTYLLSALAMRSLLVIILILISLSVPFFAYVVSFVGSSITLTMCLILPCWFYYGLFRNSIKTWEVAIFIGFTLVGIGTGVTGTVYSIMGISGSS